MWSAQAIPPDNLEYYIGLSGQCDELDTVKFVDMIWGVLLTVSVGTTAYTMHGRLCCPCAAANVSPHATGGLHRRSVQNTDPRVPPCNQLQDALR